MPFARRDVQPQIAFPAATETKPRGRRAGMVSRTRPSLYTSSEQAKGRARRPPIGYGDLSTAVKWAGRCGECPVTQERRRLPGPDGVPGRSFADRISDAGLRLRVMRPRFVSLMMRPTAPPIWLGIAVAASLIVVETFAVVYLRQITGKPFGTLYMVDVIVVSTVWGFGLSMMTSVVSAMAYAYFRTFPHTHFGPTELSFWLSIAVFLFVALSANTIAAVARTGERFSDLSSDLLGIIGPERFIRVNRACQRMLGYSEGEMTSQPWPNLIAPEDRDRMRSILDTLADSVEPVTVECRMICKGGSSRWVEWNMVWHGGLTYGIGRDVTERRRERDELRQTQAMLSASNEGLSVLAKHQEALRRMATLIAHGEVTPSEVYSAVADEMVRCLDCDGAGIFRYEPDGSAIVVAAGNKPGVLYLPVGERMPYDDDNLLAWIMHTVKPARHDDIEGARGPVIARVRQLGIRSGVGAPIVVDGRLWGAAVAASAQQELLPPDTEERVGDFADLVAAAIANAAARADLIASRARIVTATDNARRRLERDLHDGAQQRLVSLALHLRMMREEEIRETGELRMQLDRAISEASDVVEELRELSRGIHPAILSDGGLAPAMKTLARRSPVPVTLDVAIEHRLPDSVEVAAYYVVAEALTNVAKHAGASQVCVRAHTRGGELWLSIEDNGIGGAQSGSGSGLIGLLDRVEALGGHLRIVSPPGGGTSLEATLPIAVA